MKEMLMPLLVAGAVLAALQLLPAVIMYFQLLRLRLPKMRTRTVPSIAEAEQAIEEDQRAALAELRGLGFEVMSAGEVDYQKYLRPCFLLRHAERPVYAGITFMAGHLAGYPVSFYTPTADGGMLVTNNRTSWLLSSEVQEWDAEDAYADSLDAHWRRHLERIAALQPAPRDDEAVLRSVHQHLDDYLPTFALNGTLIDTPDGYRLSMWGAASAVRRWWPKRKQLAAPYDSIVTSPAFRVSFFARWYEAAEAARANRVPATRAKWLWLAATLALSLLIWSLIFDWRTGLSLILILLLHEGGHALAMRAFGYVDMHMFFVPMIGALVTGTPRRIPVWKEAIILLAGPVPGLLMGIGMLLMNAVGTAPWLMPGLSFSWTQFAVMAIAVNFFNLLPLTPLDGGRLLELALFSRWPSARMVFLALSMAGVVALALWLKSAAMIAIIVVLLISYRSQRTIARLQHAWREGLEHPEQLRHLIGTVQALLPNKSFPQQLPLIRMVFAQREVQSPRWWERTVILVLLLGLWSAAAVPAYQLFGATSPVSALVGTHSSTDDRYKDTRSAAQREFDNASAAFEEAGYDSEDELPVSVPVELDRLVQALEPGDTRRAWLQIVHAEALRGVERRQQFEAILTEGGDALGDQAHRLVADLLTQVSAETRDADVRTQAAAYQAQLERLDRALPQAWSSTIPWRITLAELMDQSGDSTQAEAMLAGLAQRVAGEQSGEAGAAMAESSGQLEPIVEAQAWLYLSRHQAERAIAVIQDSPVAASTLHKSASPLATTYAWALLYAGRFDEGVAEMKIASIWDRRSLDRSSPSIVSFLIPQRGVSRMVTQPLDIAAAEKMAGLKIDIAELNGPRLQMICKQIEMQGSTSAAMNYSLGHWQQLRQQQRDDVAKQICPQVSALKDS